MTKRIELTIYASAEQAAALRVLDDRGDAQLAVAELLARVVDGVTRPCSWERPWIEQVFGASWRRRMEADPSCAWRERPRSDRM